MTLMHQLRLINLSDLYVLSKQQELVYSTKVSISAVLLLLFVASSFAPPSLKRIIISTRESSNQQHTVENVCVCACVCGGGGVMGLRGTSSMCGQFQIFPAEPDLGQPHSEPGSCLTHLGGCCLYV